MMEITTKGETKGEVSITPKNALILTIWIWIIVAGILLLARWIL